MTPRTVSTLQELQQLAAKGELRGLFDVPIDVYHQGPGISSTGLKALLRSPAHYAQYLRGQADSVPMRNGRIVHVAVLEPEVYERDYVVASDRPKEPERPEHLKAVTRRSDEGKRILAEWEASWRVAHDNAVFSWEARHAGKNVVPASEHELAMSICDAVSRNRLAARVLRDGSGTSEISVFWTDAETGVLCKARADRLIAGVIADLKTCQDAQPKEFQRSVANYKYHLSAAFYADGFSEVLGAEHRFCWVAVETAKPHGVAFYGADEASIAVGRAEYRAALQTYKTEILDRHMAAQAEFLPSYPESFVNLSLPAWYS